MKRLFIILAILVVGTSAFAEGGYRTGTMEASSTLAPSSGVTYDASNLIDNSWTSWAEGEPGDGVGTRLTYTADRAFLMPGIIIRNGYGDLKNFYNNNRVRSIRVSDENGNTAEIELEDTFHSRYYKFATPLNGKYFTYVITAVYPGAKWNDTCLTELAPTYMEACECKSYEYPPYFRETALPEQFRYIFDKDYLQQQILNHEENDIVEDSDYGLNIEPFNTGAMMKNDTLNTYLRGPEEVLIVHTYTDPFDLGADTLAFYTNGEVSSASNYIELPEYEEGTCMQFVQKYNEECIGIRIIVEDLETIDPTDYELLEEYSYYWNGEVFER